MAFGNHRVDHDAFSSKELPASPLLEQLEPRLLLDSVSIGSTTDVMVSDGTLRSVYQEVSSAPAGATVTSVDYSIQIRDEGNAVFRCSDYDGWAWSDETDVWFWDNYGGTTDYGNDDDSADDADIFISRTTHAFDGEPVNGLWGFTVWDRYSNVWDGEIDFWWMDIYYDDVNTPPTLNLTSPSSNLEVTQGDSVTIQWTDSDPDDNAYISLARDPDTNSTPWSDSDHAWLTVSLREDIDGGGDQYIWDTTGVPAGTYSVWGMIYDGTNPEVYDRAPGLVTIELPPTTYLLYDNWGGTWVDAEKELPENAVPPGSGDDFMCWAAAASNILDWTGWGDVTGMSQDEDLIFAYFQNHWTDEGGLTEWAWDWWFDGSDESTEGAHVNVVGGGFYPAMDGTYIHTQNSPGTAMQDLSADLRAGRGVTIGVGGLGLAHALTIWGYDVDALDPNSYVGLWFTDSDDNKGTSNGDTAPNYLVHYPMLFSSGSNQWVFGMNGERYLNGEGTPETDHQYMGCWITTVEALDQRPATVVEAPLAPTWIDATDDLTDWISVSWAASDRATCYDLYRAESDEFTSSALVVADLTATQHNDLTVNPGITYYYWVKSRNSSGSRGVSPSDHGLRTETVKPTADLSHPTDGSTILLATINVSERYIGVTFDDQGGSGLNHSTITDSGQEFTLSAGGITVDGSPTLHNGSTYHYTFTGDFVSEAVGVNFTAGSWADNAGNTNAVETEQFIVDSPSLPDLIIHDTTYTPGAYKPGDNPFGGITYQNIGDEACGPFEYEVRLSTDKEWGNADDIIVDTSLEDEGLDAGEPYTDTGTGHIPVGTPNGTYYVGAMADSSTPDQIDEGPNEGNNWWWSTTSDVIVDGTAPTADLSHPTDGSTIPLATINTTERYIDVAFDDQGGSGLNLSTITDSGQEFTLSGAAAGGVTVNGSATHQHATVYRYSFTGDFVSGPVDVNFTAGSFADNAGNTNDAETEDFTVGPELIKPTADLSHPTDGSAIPLATINTTERYIDVTFDDQGGSGLDHSTITDSGQEFTLSGPGVGTAVISSGSPASQGGHTYRYSFSGDFVSGLVGVNFTAGSFADNAENTNNAEAEAFTVIDGTARTYVVDSPLDNVLADGVLTLREAIQAANTNSPVGDALGGSAFETDIITFDISLTEGTITLDGTAFTISDHLEILGLGADQLAIDANDLSRVFYVDTDTSVLLDRLTITGGNSDNGGGIYNGGALMLTNMTVSGNSVTCEEMQLVGGGGICNSGDLTLINTTVSGNSATQGWALGGGILNQFNSLLTLTNATISGNSAEEGGGIFSDGESTLTLTNTTVSGNSAADTGGGITNWGDLTLNNTIVVLNDVNGYVDDIHGSYSGAGNVVGIDPAFVRNASDGGDGWGDDPDTPGVDEGANDDYGDLRLRSTSVAVDFMGDASLLPPDTADLDGDGDTLEPVPLDLDDNTRVVGGVVDVGAYEYQGAPPSGRETPSLEVSSLADVVDIYDGAVTLREAIMYAGLDSTGGEITFASSLFASGAASIILDGIPLLIGEDMQIVGPGANLLTVDGDDHSRVFSIFNGEVGIEGMRMIGGNSSDGGGIFNDGGSSLTLTNVMVSGNSAVDEGGGIYNEYGSTLMLTNTTVSGNSGEEGGGIYSDGVLTAANTTVSGNSATKWGGGICNWMGVVTLNNTTVSGNSAGNDGGGINNWHGLTLTNTTVAGNSANDGGGIFNGDPGTLTLRNSVVAGNTGSSNDDIRGNYNPESSFVGTIDGDPMLTAITDLDGLVRYYVPMPGSPLIDAGNNALAVDPQGVPLAVDQCGMARIFNGTVDIGAIEYAPAKIDVSLGLGQNIHQMDFGAVRVGHSRSKTLTVHNRGTAELRVTEANWAGLPFSLSAVNGNGSEDDWILNAGESWEFDVTFSPSDTGDYPDTLVLASNDSDEPSYPINLDGSGVTALSAYEVWGGNTLYTGLPEHWDYYYNIDEQDYVFLGASNATGTFNGSYDYYVIGTQARVDVDTVEGSDGTFVPWVGTTGNTSDWDNISGPPDGQYGLIGYQASGGTFAGFAVVSNPGSWSDITVHTGSITPSFHFSISHEYGRNLPGLERYGQELYLSEAGLADSIRFQSPTGGWWSLERDEDFSEEQRWEFWEEFDTPEDLMAVFPDGTYSVELNSAVWGSYVTEFWFGIPGTGDPIPEPTQWPVFLVPTFGQSDVPTELILEWEPCVDPNVTSIELRVRAGDEDEVYNNWDIAPSTTTAGPVTLDAGSNYVATVAFDNRYHGQNGDGYWYNVYKEIDTDVVFLTNGGEPVLPDLFIDTFAYVPGPRASGSDFEFEVTGGNVGGNAIAYDAQGNPVPFYGQVRFSSDQVWGNEDDVVIHEWVFDYFLADDHGGDEGNVTIPPEVPSGDYYVACMLDTDGQITESDEGNNWWWSTTADVIVDGTEGLIDIDLVIVAAPTADIDGTPDTIAVLPTSLDQVGVGSTFYAEVWMQDVGSPTEGISGGYLDIAYDTAYANAVALDHGGVYTTLPFGSYDNASGLVDDFGGSYLGDERPGIGEWVLLGRVEFNCTGVGVVNFTPQESDDEFSRFSGGAVPWDQIETEAVSVDQIAASPEIQFLLLDTPSVGLTQTGLPDQAELHILEDHSFYGEAWVRSNPDSPSDITSGAVDLSFDPAYGKIESVEPVNANWSGGDNGVINNVAGTLTGLNRSTTSPSVGDDEWVLFARIEFSGSAPVDEVTHAFGPYDLDVSLTPGEFELSYGNHVAEVTADDAQIYSVIYDVDDSGRILGGDFGLFAGAYRGDVGDPEPPYCTWADFDGSGSVKGGDFGLFAGVYRQYTSDIDFSQIPERFRPAGWTDGAWVRTLQVGGLGVGAALTATGGESGLPDGSNVPQSMTSSVPPVAPVAVFKLVAEPIPAVAAPVVPIISQLPDGRDGSNANDDSIINTASALGVDLLVESPGSYIPGPSSISFGLPVTALYRAATAECDLRSLGDDLATDGQADDLLADILAESALALPL